MTILGPTNLPAEAAVDSSRMYAKNLTTFLAHLASDGSIQLDLEDEITRESMLSHEGRVTNERVLAKLGEAA